MQHRSKEQAKEENISRHLYSKAPFHALTERLAERLLNCKIADKAARIMLKSSQPRSTERKLKRKLDPEAESKYHGHLTFGNALFATKLSSLLRNDDPQKALYRS